MTEPDERTTPTTGLLGVEVKAPPVIAGQLTTISFVIRNPFASPITIESIEAPTSSLLSRSLSIITKGSTQSEMAAKKADRSSPIEGGDTTYGTQAQPKSIAAGILEKFGKIAVSEFAVGPLVARFPDESRRVINVKMERNSKLTVDGHLGPADKINIENAEGADVRVNINPAALARETATKGEERIISQYQEDIATFEIKTAKWLLIKPTSITIHALIKYRVDNEQRSQVIPINLSIQPPVASLVIGAGSGGILGFLAKQINSGVLINNMEHTFPFAISILGVVVMATIAAIVLSRKEGTQSFVTLEDFYGAFVIGVMIGYLGTGYFDNLLGQVKQST